MAILSNICNSLSTRDLASATLLTLFLLWSMRSQCVRDSIKNVLRAFFTFKILLPILILYTWIVVACFSAELLGLWRSEYVKDVVFYSLGAIPLLCETIKYSSQKDFSDLVVKQMKYTVFISVYLNLYTLSYWMELLFQAVMCFVIVMIGEANRQSKNDITSERVSGCLKTIYALMLVMILMYAIYQTVKHPATSTLTMIMQGVMLPFVLTVIILPYLYLLTVYGAYEWWFVKLSRSVNDDKEEYELRRNMLIRTCGINLRKIKYIEGSLKLFLVSDAKEFRHLVNQYNAEYKIRGDEAA